MYPADAAVFRNLEHPSWTDAPGFCIAQCAELSCGEFRHYTYLHAGGRSKAALEIKRYRKHAKERLTAIMVVGSHLRAWNYGIMIKWGYPAKFCDPITKNLNTDWTAGHL